MVNGTFEYFVHDWKRSLKGEKEVKIKKNRGCVTLPSFMEDCYLDVWWLWKYFVENLILLGLREGLM